MKIIHLLYVDDILAELTNRIVVTVDNCVKMVTNVFRKLVCHRRGVIDGLRNVQTSLLKKKPNLPKTKETQKVCKARNHRP